MRASNRGLRTLSFTMALLTAAAAPPVMAADPADPAAPPSGLTLTLDRYGRRPAWIANPAQCRVERIGGRPCLALAPDVDPYSRLAWEIRLPALTAFASGPLVVEIEFVDQGAGLIEPALHWASVPTPTTLAPVRQASYTRLNTRTTRRAWFQFNLPARPPTVGGAAILRGYGLQHLAAIRLLPPQSDAAWAARRAAVPQTVHPMVTLQRPMELVTTAGVDVLGDRSTLTASLEAMSELAPLARVLGFTSIESYVTWKRLEPVREGEFDFRFYDAIVGKLAQYQLKWFPLLIVGSGYALPDWFLVSPENVGFVCLEHGRTNSIQSIWCPSHRRHVTRVLQAFGEHYEPQRVLEGVRLGPSGNYGESQYPASGAWGARNEQMHIHIGWWAGDAYGQADYRRWLRDKYATVSALNRAWDAEFAGFDAVPTVIPQLMLSKQQRLDFTAWYTDSMSDWCAWWAGEARRALPRTPIYQSAGGWGFREAGTDYSAQTKAMVEVDGGVRLTNETDSYDQNFFATRLAATAARLYRTRLGYEPASSHTARGVVGRIYETAATQGDHLFTYHPNVFHHPLSIAKWLKYLPVLDTRQPPVVDVAVYYPETENQLSDAAFRHLYAWGFNPVAREIRRVVDVDYLDERLIRDGFLDRYKVLVFVWGKHIEPDVQAKVDAWLRQGGTVVYPSYPRGPQETITGDTSVFARWSAGDTGRGRFHRFPGDLDPPRRYGEYVGAVLRSTPGLHPFVRQALAVAHPEDVFLTVQADGHLLMLNYGDRPARVRLAGTFAETVEPYGIARVRLRR